MEEIWKPVVGYEGLYEASSTGEIRSTFRTVPHGLGGASRVLHRRLLKPWVNSKGYKIVGLSKEGQVRNHSVHRLVCDAFMPETSESECTNHKDGNKMNNASANLEHCSYSHNNKHAFSTGLKAPSVTRGEDVSNHKVTASQVAEIRRLYAEGTTGPEIAAQFSISPSNAWRIATKRAWKHL